jgi:hypothetical protein
MIFRLLIIHNHDRMSSITRVLHTTTWEYFTNRLPNRFRHSPRIVKEAIMKDINNLVQEFWRTSSDGDVGASFFEMRRLLEILQVCSDNFYVCFVILSVFATAVDLADKSYRSILPIRTLPILRYCLMGIERCWISHFLNPKISVTWSGSYLVS